MSSILSKTYAKANMKVFWFCPILFDFLTLAKYYVTGCRLFKVDSFHCIIKMSTYLKSVSWEYVSLSLSEIDSFLPSSKVKIIWSLFWIKRRTTFLVSVFNFFSIRRQSYIKQFFSINFTKTFTTLLHRTNIFITTVLWNITN